MKPYNKLKAQLIEANSFDLGTTALLILLSLQQREKPTTLADKLGVSAAAITGQVDRLEKQGLVDRSHCTNDRRIVWVEITQLGLKTISQIVSA